MEEFESLQTLLNHGLHELTVLWTEIGVEDESRNDRKKTVYDQFKRIIDLMLKEEKGYKAKLLDNLETNSKVCNKLSKEMGVSFEEPDSSLSLLKLQHAVKVEAKRLEAMKQERMREVLNLKSIDEELCTKLCMDPYYISSTTVPTTAQLDGVKDHIKRMEEEKFDREERFITMKEAILRLYTDLEEEPMSDMERYFFLILVKCNLYLRLFKGNRL